MDTPPDAAREQGFLKAWFENLKVSPLDGLFVAGVLGLAPMVCLQAMNLSQRKHLQFFPLAWAFFIVVVYLRGRPVPFTASKLRASIGFSFVGFSIVTGSGSVLYVSPWFAQLALIGLCFGWMLLRLGGNSWTTLVAWVSLIAVTLPLPLNGDSALVQSLQNRSTVSASGLLDLVGIPHVIRGNIMEIRTRDLFVDEACSGVDSLYSLLAVALMLTIWQQRRFVESFITLMLVPLWAWLGNLFRIFLIAVMLDLLGVDWSHGWPHTLLGLLIFGVAFICLLTTQAMIATLSQRTQTSSMGDHHIAIFYNRIVAWPPSTEREAADVQFKVLQGRTLTAVVACGVMFGVIGVASAYPLTKIGPWAGVEYSLPSIPQEVVKASFVEHDIAGLEPQVGVIGFEVTHRDRGSVNGEHSVTWLLMDEGQQVQLSLDFPFPGFHDLSFCYTVSGYDRELALSKRLTSKQNLDVASTVLLDQLNTESALLFTNFDINGKSVVPSVIKRSVLSTELEPTVYQLQLFFPKSGILTDEQSLRYVALLDKAFVRLLPKIQAMVKK